MAEEEEEEEEELLVVEEREAEMVPSAAAAVAGDEPVKRKGFFLAPRRNPNGNPLETPHSPKRYKSVSFSTLESPKILFKGWSSSLKQWEQWVDKLKPLHGDSWRKVGIFDAIIASTCRIRREPCSLFGVSSFWCDETNTFLFPWGEATISLEDVAVLAGFSALGGPVRAPPLEGELKDLEFRITEERLGFNRSSYKKPDHSAWLKHFVERDGDELEHVAFLSLWLSRFVFCSHPEKTIRQHVLPIAVRIARGERIALAPAVLAEVYRDMREVKDYLAGNERSKEFPLIVWAPLHILQVWIWERFASLRPETNDSGNGGGPRMARWHEVGKKTELASVQSVLNSPTEFQWRPYGTSLSDFSGDHANNEESRPFVVCLRDCELVGVDCLEQYLPHRVARQFGLDQDVPCTIPRANSKWEDAWESYEIKAKNFNFPRQLVESGVTLRYAKWWEHYIMACSSNVVEDVKEGEEPAKDVKRSQEEKKAEKKKKKKGKVLLNGKKRKLADVYGATLSDWLTDNRHNVRAKKNGAESQEPSTNAVEIQKKENLVEKPKENKKRKRAKGHEEKNHVKSEEPTLKPVEIKKKQTNAGKLKENKKRKRANRVEEKIHVKPQEPSSDSVEIKKKKTVKPKENKKKKQAKGSEKKIEHESRANVETEEGEKISRGENSASNPSGKKEKAVKNSKKKNRVKSQETLQSAVEIPKRKSRAVEPKIDKKKEKRRGRKETIEIESKALVEIKVEVRTPSGEINPSDLLAKNVKEMVERVAKLDVRERKEDGEARSPENRTVTVHVEEKVLIEESIPSGEAPSSDRMVENEKETAEFVAEGDDREPKENEEDRSPERETVAGQNDEVLTEDGKKISDEEIAEDVEMMNNGESNCSPHVMQVPEEAIPLEQEKKREENEGLTAVTGEKEKMIVEDNRDCLCIPAVVEQPEEVIQLEKADRGEENMEIVDDGSKEEEVVEEEEKRLDDGRTESEEALPNEETSQRGEEKEKAVGKDEEEEVVEVEKKWVDDGRTESEEALPSEETSQQGEEKEKAVEKDEEEDLVEEEEKRVDDERTESEEALPSEETSQQGEEKEKAVDKDEEEDVVEEEEKRVNDERTESEEALPSEETSQQGEEKEKAVEKDEEEDVVEEEEKRVDDERTESEEALPSEETSQQGEEKEKAVEKDEEEEVITEQEKRIDVGRTESEEALPAEETSQREEKMEIANKDIEEKVISSKDAEDERIVEGAERTDGTESPVCLSVVEDHETVALAEANNGEGDQEISEKSEEEKVIMEVVNRITVVQEGEGEGNGGTEEKADAEDIQRINNAGNPLDLALNKEIAEDAEGTKDEEFASDRISSCNPLGQERKENMEEVKRTNNGESENNPAIVKEKDGTLTPEKEDRRRNDGDSSNLSLKDKEENETPKNVNNESKTESSIEVIVVEENEEMASSKHVKYEIERIEEKRSPDISKESRLEMEIRKLKEEIAAIEARVLDLESIAEVQSRP